MKHIAMVLLILTQITRCAISQTLESVALSRVVGIWKYDGGEAPPMQMMFSPDGKLRFKGGLELYNPARWDYDLQHQELNIYLSPMKKPDLLPFEFHIGRYVKAVDKTKYRITYHFDQNTPSLLVGGWVFFRSRTAPLTHSLSHPAGGEGK